MDTGQNCKPQNERELTDSKQDSDPLQIADYVILLKQSLRPMFVSMSLVGLYFERNTERRWTHGLCAVIYCSLVNIIIWLHCARLCYGYTHTSGPTLIMFSKIFTHIWCLICACGCTVCYRACIKKEGLHAFLVHYARLLCESKREVDWKKMRRCVIILVFVSWILIALNMAFIGFAFYTTNLFDATLVPFGPKIALNKLLIIATLAFQSVAWIFPTFLCFLCCLMCCEEFSTFRMAFRKYVNNDGQFSGDIENLRQRHQKLCTLLRRADGCLSLYHGGSILLNVLMGLLILYNMIMYEEVRGYPTILFIHLFWLSFALLNVTIIAVGCGMVNHLAHSSVEDVYDIDLNLLSPENTLKLQTFLIKLNGTPIGMTVLNMFVINKPTILTIIGIFTTYFAVLVQFQSQSPSDQREKCVDCLNMCNGTTF